MFTLSTAEQLLQASQVNEFPIDFDAAWEWLGYSTKGNAWQSFEKAGFLTGVDFMVNHKYTGGRQLRVVQLTIDCLKQWSMMSGTDKGKQVRLYFIECERKLKQLSQPKDALDFIVAQAESIAMLARHQQETQKLLEAQQLQLEANEVRISNMEMHTTGHQDYYSLKAYVNLNKINMSNRNWSQTGKRLTDFSKKLAYEIKLVPDAKFGRVQAYHRDVLDRWFEGG